MTSIGVSYQRSSFRDRQPPTTSLPHNKLSDYASIATLDATTPWCVATLLANCSSTTTCTARTEIATSSS